MISFECLSNRVTTTYFTKLLWTKASVWIHNFVMANVMSSLRYWKWHAASLCGHCPNYFTNPVSCFFCSRGLSFVIQPGLEGEGLLGDELLARLRHSWVGRVCFRKGSEVVYCNKDLSLLIKCKMVRIIIMLGTCKIRGNAKFVRKFVRLRLHLPRLYWFQNWHHDWVRLECLNHL